MKFYVLIVALFIAQFSAAYERVNSVKQINFDMPPQAEKWVVFDIDNTLIEPTEQVGSVQWVEELARQAKSEGLTTSESSEFMHQLFQKLQPQIKVHPIESDISTQLSALYQQGYKVLALTARAPSLEVVTNDQVFRQANLLLNVSLPKFDKTIGYTYSKGIIFANGRNKGEILAHLVESAKVRPSKIIFVDDKDYNVKDAENYFKENQSKICGTELVAYQYDGALKRVQSISPRQTRMEYLIRKLSNFNSSVHGSELIQIFSDPLNLAKVQFNPKVPREFVETQRGPKNCQNFSSSYLSKIRCEMDIQALYHEDLDDGAPTTYKVKIHKVEIFNVAYNSEFQIYEPVDIKYLWDYDRNEVEYIIER